MNPCFKVLRGLAQWPGPWPGGEGRNQRLPIVIYFVLGPFVAPPGPTWRPKLPGTSWLTLRSEAPASLSHDLAAGCGRVSRLTRKS